MDITDYKIINILQEDGRISMKDLGKIVGLTSPAVSERVKRLEESGVIQGYKAVVNPDKLGRVIKSFINIALPSKNYQDFIEYAQKDNRIVECHHITGDDCSLLKVIVKDKNGNTILRLCDVHTIPVATNIATAEVIVTALDRGDLDWREIVNPRSAYNLRLKNKSEP